MLLAETGVGLEVIAELAGHADIRTTKRYGQVNQHRPRGGGPSDCLDLARHSAREPV